MKKLLIITIFSTLILLSTQVGIHSFLKVEKHLLCADLGLPSRKHTPECKYNEFNN